MKTTAPRLPRKIFLVAMVLFACSRATFSETILTPLALENYFQKSRQLVLVTTDNWEKTSGTLQTFERESAAGEWRALNPPIPIVVGRNGLAWGRGLHKEIKSNPVKKEGDGKSPAGIFRLPSAFGFAPPEAMKLKLPYLQITEAIECVDDVKSPRYNSIVDHTHVISADWESSEKMLAIGEPYRLGVVVDHNVDPRSAGKGSCIFLHIWKGDGSGTSGCTAMAGHEMEKLISWLDARANPVLVQLPQAEFQQRRAEWHLPQIDFSDRK